ncbi:MAG: glycosyltransferase family 2 protein [Gammaproteobacteria bacterium]|nr:glycosyltransferase family 2 protein [Gammaproteobacteria bacterium]
MFDRRNRYCVCVFVINEGERIVAQLEKMRPLANDFDIIIADGGSTDGSLATDGLERAGVRALLTKTGAGKLGAQMRMALFYALQQGYDGVIVIDGNNKDDPAAIPRFAQALDKGFDHIQGSRFIAQGVAVNTPVSRLLGLKLVHAPLVSLASGFRYTDTTNGFRAYSRRLLEDARVAPFREVFAGYELHYYLAIRAARLGFKVTEVPVTREYPTHGKTPTKISPLKGNATILKALFKACLHRFDPADV